MQHLQIKKIVWQEDLGKSWHFNFHAVVVIQMSSKIVKIINSQPKSLYRSRAGSHFYETEYVILILVPLAIPKKKFASIMSNF